MKNSLGRAPGSRVLDRCPNFLQSIVGLDLVDREPSLLVEVDKSRKKDRRHRVTEDRAVHDLPVEEIPGVEF